MSIDTKDQYTVVKVDFRNQLKTQFSPFVMEANHFIMSAVSHIDKIKDEAKKDATGLKITNDWLDMLNMRDVVDLGAMPTKSEMARYTGMSLEEVLLLEAAAYAEVLGLDITPLEKSASEYNIYGPHFPGRAKDNTPNLTQRGTLRGDPAP